MKINNQEVDLTPQMLIEELIKFKHTLGRLNGEIIKLGNEKSQAEYDYRLLKAKTIVTLRANGYQTTLIPDLVKGDEEVAKLKMILDSKEVLYDNKRENIRSLRDIISTYQSILNYLKAEMTNGLKIDY